MIISLPNDGRGLLYHILDLDGQTVHAYRDLDAALRAREGDQRIAIRQEPNARLQLENRWLTGAPTPEKFGSTVTVDRAALRQVLQALIGAEHEIRELQATRGPLRDSPIEKLIRQYNGQVGK